MKRTLLKSENPERSYGGLKLSQNRKFVPKCFFLDKQYCHFKKTLNGGPISKTFSFAFSKIYVDSRHILFIESIACCKFSKFRFLPFIPKSLGSGSLCKTNAVSGGRTSWSMKLASFKQIIIIGQITGTLILESTRNALALISWFGS